jgi:hypothetical protein
MLDGIYNHDDIWSHPAYAAYFNWIQRLDTSDLVAEQNAARRDSNVIRGRIRLDACADEFRARQAADRRKLDEWNRAVAS